MTTRVPFGGRVLVLGAGAVSHCLLPLLVRHLDMDFSKLTVMDFEDQREHIRGVLETGARFVQHRVDPDNFSATLADHLGSGDLLIDLAWNIESAELIQWCHDHNVLYINTSVELWDPYADIENLAPTDRTLYVRHMALRKMAGRWKEPGATAVVEHGANPGLVSHWTKVALEDLSRVILDDEYLPSRRRAALERALQDEDYARVAMHTGTKVIHISERDTQISNMPKQVGEFVNTWSVAGFHEEGIAPAEIGWGTHERRLPPGAQTHRYGPGNQICLSQMGINTFVRSWVPSGEIVGMVIRHGEAFTLSDFLTVREDDIPVYRPTVHYAYLPTDAAMASVHEMRMNSYELQFDQRVMSDDIVSGRDELGVLLLGHDLTGWWTGSQLDIHESRQLAPGQNATTLQVAASVLGALCWMIRNPRMGLCVPDNLPHREVLKVANPYLGPCPSIHTDWTPLKNRWDPFEQWGRQRPDPADIWRFETFLL